MIQSAKEYTKLFRLDPFTCSTVERRRAVGRQCARTQITFPYIIVYQEILQFHGRGLRGSFQPVHDHILRSVLRAYRRLCYHSRDAVLVVKRR